MTTNLLRVTLCPKLRSDNAFEFGVICVLRLGPRQREMLLGGSMKWAEGGGISNGSQNKHSPVYLRLPLILAL